MKSVLTALLIAAATAIPVSASLAEEAYYVELGHEGSDEDTAKEWKTLAEKHKSLLGKLQFYPTSVLRADGTSITRIQAGPIDGKKKAQKLCSQLFKKDVACFVIEGVEHHAVTHVVQEKSASSLPWSNASAAVAEPEMVGGIQRSRKSFMPWILVEDQKTAEEEKPAEAPKPVEITAAPPPAPAAPVPDVYDPAEANKVKVAEAIRVPLSGDQKMESPIYKPALQGEISSKPLDPVEKSDSILKKASASETPTPGWLNVEKFADEGIASDFWQRVREVAPDQSAGLRVRTLRPLAEDNSPVSLNVGPFPGHEDAMTFCHNSILPQDGTLRCHFTREEAKGAAKLLTARYKHTDSYAERRKSLQARNLIHEGRQRVDNSVASAPAGNGHVYWIQVVQANTQMEAASVWEDLRTTNADLLENTRSSISAVATGRGGYVVRIGPMSDHNKTLSIYKALQERGITSRIYSNM